MHRRTFLKTAGALAAGCAATYFEAEGAASPPIIDAHIHLFDPTRPEGVPWPEKSDALLYKPALPERYRKIAQPLGVVGAIEIECSPWLNDNFWVLKLAATDNIIVGTIGNLSPGTLEFRAQLEKLRTNPLFRGIRYGNLWDHDDLGASLNKEGFVSDLRVLAEADLVLDTANPNPALIADVRRLSDRVPNLRVVIDHLPQAEPPTETSARREYESTLRELGQRPNIYIKGSEVFRRVEGRVPEDLAFYKPRLDELWQIFGEDRVIFGSDWPNGDQWKPYEPTLNLVREYISGRGASAAEKYFWKNSLAAYKWKRRSSGQP